MAHFSKSHPPPGTPPGELIFRKHPATPEETTVKKSRITVISYSPEDYEEKQVESFEDCSQYWSKRDVTWVNIDGSQDVETLRKIGEQFGFHPLTLEDIAGADQRPKIESFGNYIFITTKLPKKRKSTSPIEMEQANILLGSDFVLTIQDSGNAFEAIRQRIKEDRGRIRKMKADYLAYSLIDLVVDQYFPIMESTADQIESIEDELQQNFSPGIVRRIREIKRDLILVRSSIWPMRELINSLNIEGSNLIDGNMRMYLRDLYDHTIHIADLIESYRDILSEMFNLYLSITANNTNEVMRFLTVFSTIFIPLTFIVGIYGMNFEFMPELKWKPAYFILLGVMLATVALMLRFFKRRGWLKGIKKL